MTAPGRLACLLALLASLALSGYAQSPSSPREPRRSGFEDMGAATQSMQRDDSQNPGMLWLKQGEALWSREPGGGGKACAACHAAAPSSMVGIAARYPAFDALLGRPVNLSNRINLCRQRHQQSAPLAYESDELLSLEAWVAHASRGLPVTPPSDPRLVPFRARGEQLFNRRIGQLALSCAQCHDQHAGGRLGGSTIVQGHPTGYPLYRLEWEALGSLARRLRGCMTGVRAEPLAPGSTELVELELYLAQRAMGMAIETPAVRP